MLVDGSEILHYANEDFEDALRACHSIRNLTVLILTVCVVCHARVTHAHHSKLHAENAFDVTTKDFFAQVKSFRFAPATFDDEVFGCLREHNRALCMAEMDETESSNLIPTATWGYVRLRRSEYSRADLLNWKERILSQQWDHAYIFFKHEDEGIGPRLAGEFLELAGSE